jgi:pilus assembly protein CpaE
VSPAAQIRIILVEDVPQVTQYVRGLLNTAPQIQLLEVLTDARALPQAVAQQRPDVVVIDALLQGKIKGLQAAEMLRRSELPVATVIVTVPQHPVTVDHERGVDAVLSMPFSGYELVTRVQGAHAARQARDPGAGSLVVSVYAPKGGVGKTTLAFNLAVALGQGAGKRTVLVDGSLRFGDLRTLLKVPADAPSILDLPTDRIQESDLTDVLWRDPSGIDILLAPPRVEMAEMVTVRDIDKVLSLLRRVYAAVVIDTPANLDEATLQFLDTSDVILQIVTHDSTTIHNTVAVAEAFHAIGYPASKSRYVINRADSTGGIDNEALARALGRAPEHSVVSDGRLVIDANNQGVPFVLSAPGARISQDIGRLAAELVGLPRLAGARV